MTRDHNVKHLTTAELERTKRELCANLGLITPYSPAHAPIRAHMTAIDAELAERTGNQKINGSAAVSTGTEPVSCDPLTALSNEYGDHRRIDVTLMSDSVSGLAEKLRAFTELIRELP
jgi:hypothetical protein